MIIENQITKLFSPLSGRLGRLELSVIPLFQFAATVPQFSFRCEPPPRLYYCGWGMFLALSYIIRRGRRLLAAKLIQFNADWPQVGDVTVHYREQKGQHTTLLPNTLFLLQYSCSEHNMLPYTSLPPNQPKSAGYTLVFSIELVNFKGMHMSDFIYDLSRPPKQFLITPVLHLELWCHKGAGSIRPKPRKGEYAIIYTRQRLHSEETLRVRPECWLWL